MQNYTIKKSTRARALRITIHSDTSVVITVPHRTSITNAEKFIEQKKDWIKKNVEKMKIRIAKHPASTLPKASRKDLLENKEKALLLVGELLQEFNKIYNLKWNNVSVKNTKSRWGSCSKKGNLNFNYKIIYLPKALAEYLVVHEMCHLKQMNHSVNFWKLVEIAIPEYKSIRKQLKVI